MRARHQRPSRFTIATLAVCFGLLATGCSSAKTTTTAKKINVRIWRVGQDVDPLRDVITAFNKDNKDVLVTYKRKSASNYEQNSLKSMAGRQGPDVWSISSDQIGDMESILKPLPANFYYTKGATSGPVTLDTVKTLFPDGVTEQILSTDGKSVLGLPSSVDSLQLYYNSDLFKLAADEYRRSLPTGFKEDEYTPVRTLLSKPPTTWETLLAQVRYLTKKGPNDTLVRSSIALGTTGNISNSADILQLLMMQNGVRVVSTDRSRALFTQTIDSPTGTRLRPGQKALEFYTSFSNPKSPMYSWNTSMPSTLDAFGQGRVAMVIAFTDFGKQLKAKYPKFQYEVTSVPQISTTQDQVNLIRFNLESVTQVAESSNAAFAFLGTYASEKNSKTLSKEAKLTSPYLKSLQATSSSSDYLTKQVLSGKAVFKKSHADFDKAFEEMISDVVQNGLPTDITLDTGAEKVNQLLAPQDE